MTTAAVDEAKGPSAAPAPSTAGSGYTQAAILIVVGVLATTLAQPGVLSAIPFRNLLKNELHASRSETSAFIFLSGIAWYFKPLAGIFTDAFPIFGTRRRSYLLISTVLATLAWIGIIFTPHEYNALLWVAIVINLFMVIASTVIGGYMVEVARANAGSGRLSAIRNITSAVVGVIQSPAGGILANIAFGWTAGLSGAVMFLLFPATLLLLKEERRRTDTREVLANAGRQLSNIAGARTLWAAAGLTLLFFIAPGFGTALFYKQQDELHMTTVGQGVLGLVSSVGALTSPFVYIWACRRLNLRRMLLLCLGASTLTVLFYTTYFYNSVAHARLIEGVNGFTSALAEVALMDLAVRATPVGSEGLGFSLMVSVRNLAIFGTDTLGSLMLDKWHLPFNLLVLGNAGTTLLTLPLVMLLPGVLVRGKDAEVLTEEPAPASEEDADRFVPAALSIGPRRPGLEPPLVE